LTDLNVHAQLLMLHAVFMFNVTYQHIMSTRLVSHLNWFFLLPNLAGKWSVLWNTYHFRHSAYSESGRQRPQATASGKP